MNVPTGPLYVGQALSRVDAGPKVTGAADYAHDRLPEGVGHAVLVGSPVAKGRIVVVDAAAAESVPGVLAVVTHENAPRLNKVERVMDLFAGQSPQENFPPLQGPEVHYAGQVVAMVVAETVEAARFAASRLRIEAETDPGAATDLDTALPRAYDVPQFFGQDTRTRQGDPEAALASALVVVRQTYTTPIEHHAAMELHGAVAAWEGGELTLYEPTQWVGGASRTVAAALGVPAESVRVVNRFLGGGFGGKGMAKMHSVVAAAVARELGRPVKLTLTREQVFPLGGSRPATRQEVALGAERDGRLIAIEHESWSTTSEVDTYLETCGFATRELYACPNVTTAHHAVPVNTGTPCPMRAPGEAPGSFALESALDELAHGLGLDPVELRLRNYADLEPGHGRPWSDKNLKECYARAAQAIGWAKRDPCPRAQRKGRKLVGLGMATAIYPVFQVAAEARARLLADGTAVVSSATADIGTGTYTIMTQIAADRLGLLLDAVRFELGDSDLPRAPAAVGALTANSVGPAVASACDAVRRRLVRLAVGDGASPLANWPEERVVVAAGRVQATDDPARGEAVSAVLRRHGLAHLEEEGRFAPGGWWQTHGLQTWGAQFAEVAVDEDTGEVRLRRVASAFDFGRVLNPKTARNQLVGGILFGIGMALLEEASFDPQSHRPLNAGLGGYLVPVQADVPEVEVIMLDKPDWVASPSLGAKGVGEIGNVGIAAAIANAVFNATGVRVRDLPITPEKLLTGLL